MRRFFYWVGEKVKGVLQPLILDLTTTQFLLTKYRAAYPDFQESLEEELEDIGSPFQSPTARGEGLAEVPTEGPTLTPVQVGVTKPANRKIKS